MLKMSRSIETQFSTRRTNESLTRSRSKSEIPHFPFHPVLQHKMQDGGALKSTGICCASRNQPITLSCAELVLEQPACHKVRDAPQKGWIPTVLEVASFLIVLLLPPSSPLAPSPLFFLIIHQFPKEKQHANLQSCSSDPKRSAFKGEKEGNCIPCANPVVRTHVFKQVSEKLLAWTI